MARARSLKPGFFKNEELAALSPLARILFSGIWTIADREGRLEDRPKRIKAEILPYDSCDVNKLLESLAGAGFILRYRVDGEPFIAIPNWHKHQKPHHMELPSEIPAPNGSENRYKHTRVTKQQRERVFKRDGYKCKRCGSTEQLSIDHVIPVSKGGTSEDSNLSTLCLLCNVKKGNRIQESITSQDQVDDDVITARDQSVESDTRSTLSFNLNLDNSNLNPIPLTVNPEALNIHSDAAVPAATKAVCVSNTPDLFQEFIGAFLAAGVKLNERDIHKAAAGNSQSPGFLSFEEPVQRQIVEYAIDQAKRTEARFMGLPVNFLDKRGWERKGIVRVLPTPKQTESRDKQEEAGRLFDERFGGIQ